MKEILSRQARRIHYLSNWLKIKAVGTVSAFMTELYPG